MRDALLAAMQAMYPIKAGIIELGRNAAGNDRFVDFVRRLSRVLQIANILVGALHPLDTLGC